MGLKLNVATLPWFIEGHPPSGGSGQVLAKTPPVGSTPGTGFRPLKA